MYCKLITENDCAVNAVLSCTPVEFLIINKAIARCSNDEFYTESDRRTMVLMGEAMKNFEQVEVADTPQTDIPSRDELGDCNSCEHLGDLRCGMCTNGSGYKRRADTPQTDCNTNQCVQRVEYVGNDEKSRCWACKHFERMHETPISSDGSYYTYVVCTAKECNYEPKDELQTERSSE